MISISTSLLKEKVVNKQVKANYVIFKKIPAFMNASSNVSNVEIANKIASTAALFRKYFPDASVNFSPGTIQIMNPCKILLILRFISLVGVLLLNVEQYSYN